MYIFMFELVSLRECTCAYVRVWPSICLLVWLLVILSLSLDLLYDGEKERGMIA